MKEKEKDEYMEQVFHYLETLDYPNMIREFSVESVGKSLGPVMMDAYHLGISPRMCSINIWSLTMVFQIIPKAKRSSVN